MHKNWIKLDYTKYNDLWEEASTLYWCGGDSFAIVWTRYDCNHSKRMFLDFYNSKQIQQVWQSESVLQLF